MIVYEKSKYIKENTTIGQSCYQIDDVVNLACSKHQHQKRKDGSQYIEHCIRVADMAFKFAENTIEKQETAWCIGLLHDILEDTETDYEDIYEVAGAHIADCVSSLSDDKRLPSSSRHTAYIQRLERAQFGAHIVKLADLCDNFEDSKKLDKEQRVKWCAKALELTCIFKKIVMTTYPIEKTIKDLEEKLKRQLV